MGIWTNKGAAEKANGFIATPTNCCSSQSQSLCVSGSLEKLLWIKSCTHFKVFLPFLFANSQPSLPWFYLTLTNIS